MAETPPISPDLPISPETTPDGLVRDPKHGLWTRPWTNDADEVHQTMTHYRHMPSLDGMVALDLGAHIGASAALMRAKGARLVLGVEPDPDNARLAKMNADESTFVLVAAMNRNGGVANLARNMNGHTTTHYTAFHSPRRVDMIVPALPFRGLYDSVRPEVLKVDIEYGEWDFYEHLWDLPHTKVIQIEFHFNHFKDHLGDFYRKQARLTGVKWAEAGFTKVRGSVSPKAWFSEQLWVRDLPESRATLVS